MSTKPNAKYGIVSMALAISIAVSLVLLLPSADELWPQLVRDPGSAEVPELSSVTSGATQVSEGELPAEMMGSFSVAAQSAPQEERQTVRLRRDPARVIRDSTPSFSSVAVDPLRGEAVAADENLHQILVYDRMDNTPANASMTEPKRILGGEETGIEFVCGLYIDPPTGDIYATHADTAAKMLVFSRDQEGNVPAARVLNTGYATRGRGIAVDDRHDELFLTSQHNSAVVIFRKEAEGDEPPIRLLQGDQTRLANPHGVVIHFGQDLIFVTNHGHVSSRLLRGPNASRQVPTRPLGREFAVPGTGRFQAPSINVYPRDAGGDMRPLRVIQGPRTQLDWPSGIALDERSGELYIANDTGQSILVFDMEANGNVAPIRVLKGPETNLDSPVGLFVDTQNEELWVANYGNNSLHVFELSAEGNTAPMRTIRSGPLGKRALMIGNPGALAYDSNREEILVPN